MSRDEHIVELFVAGYTYQEIGDEYGISRERVRQIVKDLPKAAWDQRRKNKLILRSQAVQAMVDDIRYLLMEGCSTQEICGSTGLSEGAVRSIINEHFPRSDYDMRNAAVQKQLGDVKWTDEEIVKSMLKAAKIIGPKMTVAQYEQLRLSGVDLPSKATIAHRRTWNEFKIMAGLDTNKTHDKYTNRYQDEDYIAAIQRIADLVGRPPSISDYRNNRTDREPSLKYARLWAAKHYENWVDAVYRVTGSLQ